MRKQIICVKIDSKEYGFRAYAKFWTPFINPGVGGFTNLILQVNGRRIGHVKIDWPRACRVEEGDYLVAQGNIDEVHAKLPRDADLTQLMVETMRRKKWLYFTGIGPKLDKKRFDEGFDKWVKKNL
ncbi:hypothetical protein H6789_00160 [Candidatus Nomurabacteria bacterium]|nr:hypothetical protein [Candidatus Nomurabacteria bacterium]